MNKLLFPFFKDGYAKIYLDADQLPVIGKLIKSLFVWFNNEYTLCSKRACS